MRFPEGPTPVAVGGKSPSVPSLITLFGAWRPIMLLMLAKLRRNLAVMELAFALRLERTLRRGG